MPGSISLDGLPLYYVNKIISKNLEDGTILVVCGLQMGERFTALYATVSPTAVAMTDGADYLKEARGVMISH